MPGQTLAAADRTCLKSASAHAPDSPIPSASGRGNAVAIERNCRVSCASVSSFIFAGPVSSRRKVCPLLSASNAIVRVPPPSMPKYLTPAYSGLRIIAGTIPQPFGFSKP
jgi:hypothetical protein